MSKERKKIGVPLYILSAIIVVMLIIGVMNSRGDVFWPIAIALGVVAFLVFKK